MHAIIFVRLNQRVSELLAFFSQFSCILISCDRVVEVIYSSQSMIALVSYIIYMLDENYKDVIFESHWFLIM